MATAHFRAEDLQKLRKFPLLEIALEEIPANPDGSVDLPLGDYPPHVKKYLKNLAKELSNPSQSKAFVYLPKSKHSGVRAAEDWLKGYEKEVESVLSTVDVSKVGRARRIPKSVKGSKSSGKKSLAVRIAEERGDQPYGKRVHGKKLSTGSSGSSGKSNRGSSSKSKSGSGRRTRRNRRAH